MTSSFWHSKDRILAHIDSCFEQVEEGKTKLPPRAFEMTGFTGKKTRMFYNALCDIQEPTHYFEVGSWLGSSTASACYKNDSLRATIVDNWSEFSGSLKAFNENAGWALNEAKTALREGDFFSMNLEDIPPVHIYLYDGDHSPEAHRLAIVKIRPLLASPFAILVIDDWNWTDVREGTQRGIEQTGLEVVYKREMFTDYETEKEDSYWNGIAVFVVFFNKF